MPLHILPNFDCNEDELQSPFRQLCEHLVRAIDLIAGRLLTFHCELRLFIRRSHDLLAVKGASRSLREIQRRSFNCIVSRVQVGMHQPSYAGQRH